MAILNDNTTVGDINVYDKLAELSADKANGTLINASDIDNITETGVYYVEGMINDDNEDEILLIVVRGNTRIAQYTFSDDDTIRYRTKTITGNWASGWEMIHDPHAAPINHASTSETYGLASATTFGHVRLSDNTTSNANVTAGIAATPAAVKAAYDKANIKKNSDSDTGDIISTHLTVGTRGSGGSIGNRSFTSGLSNTASGNSSISVGYHSTASGNSSISVGYYSTASGNYSIAMGHISEATGDNSVSLGKGNTASGKYSLATGFENKATGDYSVAMNYWNTALDGQTVTGHYNKEGIAGSWTGTIGDAFIIGNGSSKTHSNAFRVAYNGSVYALSAFNSTGADYAELLEWEDGNTDNADRRGLFVTWGANDKIKIASAGDEIVGIISATSSVIGNAYEDSWQGMYLTDVFGQPITQTVHHDAEYIDVEVPDTDEDGNILETTHTEQQLLHEAYDAEEYAVNPEYDPTQEYIPRSQRKEWAKVGMLGQLIVIDDGICTVGGYCNVGDNGKATAAESGYKVLKRIDDTHIKIFFK